MKTQKHEESSCMEETYLVVRNKDRHLEYRGKRSNKTSDEPIQIDDQIR